MGKALSVYWGAALMLLPFYVRFNSLNDVRISKTYLLLGLVVGSVILFGWGKRTNFVLLCSSIVLLLISHLNHVNFYSAAGLEQVMGLSTGLLLLCHLDSLRDRLHWCIIRPCIAWVCVISSVIVVLNVYGFNPYGAPVAYPVGPLGQQTLSAALIAMSAPALFSSSFIYALPLPIAALYFCSSAFGWFSFVSAMITLFMMHKPTKEKILSCVSLIALIGMIGLSLDWGFVSDNHRFATWNKMIDLYLQWDFTRQLVGMGTGHFWDSNIAQFMGKPFNHVHNEYLEAVYSLGSIGLIAFGGILIMPFLKRHKFNPIAFAGLTAALVNSIGNFTFHLAPLALLAIIYYTNLFVRRDSHGNYIYA